MGDRRIYAGYYKQYDGKLIYVVTVARNTDSNEDVVIWTPFSYSGTHQYFTTNKKSFCEYITVDGKRQAKYRRQTQMKITSYVIDSYEADGFRGPIRKDPPRLADEYDEWYQIHAASYYDYAKKLCEQYRLCVKKYQLCVTEKRYIGITKTNFLALKEDLHFLRVCLKTVLNDYAGYFEERFVRGLSIRKYAQAHDLNRGSVDHLQQKFFTALAQALQERDRTEGKDRLQP